jgi:hypothetical protein
MGKRFGSRQINETFANCPFLLNFCACPVECLPNEMFTQLNFKPFSWGRAYFIGANLISPGRLNLSPFLDLNSG